MARQRPGFSRAVSARTEICWRHACFAGLWHVAHRLSIQRFDSGSYRNEIWIRFAIRQSAAPSNIPSYSQMRGVAQSTPPRAPYASENTDATRAACGLISLSSISPVVATRRRRCRSLAARRFSKVSINESTEGPRWPTDTSWNRLRRIARYWQTSGHQKDRNGLTAWSHTVAQLSD